jgi:hypothetical protein
VLRARFTFFLIERTQRQYSVQPAIRAPLIAVRIHRSSARLKPKNRRTFLRGSAGVPGSQVV